MWPNIIKKIMDLCDLVTSLSPKAAKWNSIGLQLGLSADELDIIETNHNTVEQRLVEVLKKWHGRTLHPTWEVVIAALKSPLVGDPALAEKLESKIVIPGEQLVWHCRPSSVLHARGSGLSPIRPLVLATLKKKIKIMWQHI